MADLRQRVWQMQQGLPLAPRDASAVAAAVEQAVEAIRRELDELWLDAQQLEPRVQMQLQSEVRGLESEVGRLMRWSRSSAAGPGAEPRFTEVEAGGDRRCEAAPALVHPRVTGAIAEEIWLRLPAASTGRTLRVETPGANRVRLAVYPHCPIPGESPRAAGEGEGGTALDLAAGLESPPGLFVQLVFGPKVKGRYRFEVVEGSGRIEGVVVELDGLEPVAGASVEAWGPSGGRASVDVTGEDGRYCLDGLSEGRYVVAAVPPTGRLVGRVYGGPSCVGGISRGCSLSDGHVVELAVDSNQVLPPIALVSGGVVAGRVRAQADLSPVSSARVQLYSPGGTPLASTYTDSQGRYAFTSRDGEFRLTANASGFLTELYTETVCGGGCLISSGAPVTVTAGTSRYDVDFTLDLGSSLRGRVLSSDGPPLSPAWVEVREATGSPYYSRYFVGSGGNYSVDGIPPGRYFVRALATDHAMAYLGGFLCSYAGCWNWTCDESGAQTIDVPLSATVLAEDLTLPRHLWIEGVVREEGSGAAIDGVRVTCADSLGCHVGESFSDVSGRFESGRLPPSEYRVSTRDAADHFDELYDGFNCGTLWCPEPPAGTPVSLGLVMPRTGVDFSLTRGASISGRVLDALGAPALICFPQGVNLYRESGAGAGTACTSLDGAYSFRRLFAGTYFVTAAPAFGFEREVFDNLPCPTGVACPVLSGTPIVLAGSEQRSGVDFSLDRWHRFRARVFDATGTVPFPYPGVTPWKPDGSYASSVNSSNASGEVEVNVAPTPVVYLTASADGAERELYPGVPCPGDMGTDCLLSSGTAFPAQVNGSTEGLDFTLRPAGVGGVVRDGTGRALEGVGIDVFDLNGARTLSVISDAIGGYWVPSGSATLRLGTDNGRGAVDQLWQSIPCPNGPAWLGLCDLSLATPVTVRSFETIEGIDFVLAGWPVFKNGFENGSLVGWSGAESQ